MTSTLTSERHSITEALPTVAERREAGRAARRALPRRVHAEWDVVGGRTDRLDLLLAQGSIRAPELLPIRYGRMVASPWTYLRGAAAVMAKDLASIPNSGLEVQLCGDAHVLNFGLWATPERSLSFDLRDFDETSPGPFEWDVKRLAASLVVLARDNGMPEETGADAVTGALRAYRNRVGRYAEMAEMDIWYDHIHVEELLAFFDGNTAKRIRQVIVQRGAKRTSLGAFDKLTTVVDGKRVIRDDPPLLIHPEHPDALRVVDDVIKAYVASLPDDRRHLLDRFQYVDAARKVVGVGSVGMRVFLLLLQGRDDSDPLFLQVKQAGPSVIEDQLGTGQYANHGERVVQGQRLIQSSSDIFLGWTKIDELAADFYVRQFRDFKVIPESSTIAPILVRFAVACGEVLARSHARSGDAVAIAGYLGNGSQFDDAVATFAQRYADQTQLDHQCLADAIANGAVEADAGW